VKGKIAAGWSIAASFAAVMVVGWMVMQQQTQSGDELAPVEVAQSIPAEYLTAHQASAPSASSYYIQSVSYAE
jgi:sigma-E factor negative regulatory protein RseA